MSEKDNQELLRGGMWCIMSGTLASVFLDACNYDFIAGHVIKNLFLLTGVFLLYVYEKKLREKN